MAHELVQRVMRLEATKRVHVSLRTQKQCAVIPVNSQVHSLRTIPDKYLLANSHSDEPSPVGQEMCPGDLKSQKRETFTLCCGSCVQRDN